MSREYTKEEVREQFLAQVRHVYHYWANLPDKSDIDRCEGVAFSILNIIDGTSAALPAFDLSVSPHPEDKDFLIGEGENYYKDKQVINDDCMLHELLFKRG
ncbi:hypothetical protein [Citrobacter phage vB_CfrS_K1M]